MHGVQDQHTPSPIHGRIDAADQPIPVKDRKHVVAVLPLRLRHVDLHAEVETEELLGPASLRDQVVER